MTSLVTIHDLMKRVSRAFHKGMAQRNGRAYGTARLHVPGLGTRLQIPGVDVQDLIVPTAQLQEKDKVEVLTEALAYLNDDVVTVEARRQMVSSLGYKVVSFTLLGVTPAQRVARLVWALGKGCEHEIGPSTLVIKSQEGEYGVREGLLVGGPYNGFPQPIDTTPITEVDRIIKTRSRTLIEANTILRCREDPDAYWILCLLYARSEWDNKVVIKTLLKTHPKMSLVNWQEVANRIMTEEDPYLYLFKKLVPLCMPYTDFVSCFSNPIKRGDVRTSARLNLIRKLQSLPFFN